MSKIPISNGQKPVAPEGTIQSLRAAVREQEFKVWSVAEDVTGAPTALDVTVDGADVIEGRRLCAASDEQLRESLPPTESDDLEDTHWSASLETINSSTCALKQRLRRGDELAAALIAELESLRAELKRKDKEIKKVKFLLKAEREMFDQYKKDTCSEVMSKKSEENTAKKTIGKKKSAVEIEMMKSELAHYKQMYGEMKHTVQRLEREVNTLKKDRQYLRAKMGEDEMKSSQFLSDTTRRFEVCRKEFEFALSRSLDNDKCPTTKSAICKIVDRNARLAYDNSMLKLDLESKRAELEECLKGSSKVTKTQSLTARFSPLYVIEEESNMKRQAKALNERGNQGHNGQINGLGLNSHTKINPIHTVKTSTNLIELALENRTNINMKKIICSESAESVTVRSESEPNLSIKNGKGE